MAGPRRPPRPARDVVAPSARSEDDADRERSTGTAAPAVAPAVPVPPDRSVAPDPAVPSGPGYLPALDGLRAVSVLAVVAYHLGELEGGFLGVDVFFVISGFLITRLLLAEHERNGRIALGAFWTRRFKRLLPALLVVLLAVAVGSRAWLPAWRLTDVRNDIFGALAYVANWRFVLSGQSYFQSGVAPSPIRHTWSLAIEEQFYVVWPLVVVGVCALARAGARRLVGTVALVLAVASAAWMAVASAQGRDLSRLYYGTDTRLFALCLGAWSSTWWDGALRGPGTRARRRRRLRLGAGVGSAALVPVGVLFVVGRTDEAAFYRFGFQLMAVLATVAVVGLAAGEGPVSRALGSPVPRWLGRRSYGIYLWSWPTQVFATEHLRWEGLGLDALVVVVAIGLATLSFRLVEEPIRTGHLPWTRTGAASSAGPRVRRRPAFVVPVVAVLAVVGVSVGVSAGAPPEPRYLAIDDGDVLAGALAGADDEPVPTVPTTVPGADLPPGPFGDDLPLVVPPTASAAPVDVFGRPLRVMIAGDSVGWSIGWDLRGQIDPDLRVDDRALIGCGLMPIGARFIVGDEPPHAYTDICRNTLAAEGAGLRAKPDVVLLWVGAWEVYDQQIDGRRYTVGTDAYAEVLEHQLDDRVAVYRAFGLPTLLPIVPCFAPGAAAQGTERLDPERRAWVNERIRAVAERNPGWVRLIDPEDTLCEADGTARTATPDGIPLRLDGAHFDPPEAIWFWNTWLGGQVAAAFPPRAPATTTTIAAPGDPATTTTAPTGSTTTPP